ncbi:DUF2207 domain-containing protein [Domibacillus sp. A3M-37]|uniref:DUF2207 domain-containing protein n=1 Tax=Domibacillus sp. A3M-37 TaxID=2962037 RepID=UPI0020B6B1ED|nr:DUF2207 domain-containing protein [Domibacillus sp. A3M-37]MCP3763959.1 DUF2207 domain-containing protein [Domibacillus sp. A3M-37]
MKKQLLFFILFLFTFATPAMARSYNIDEVQIRAWIQTNGNVLVNEIFHYTFNGKYDHAIRSIHTDGHNGVQNFEAYELTNKSAEPGFVNQADLQSLTVSRDENTYSADLLSEDEEKSVFFTYELVNAVRSYEAYSDLTIPFFGTDDHHDKTLENVTIDVVFPESIEPSRYYAFMHDRFGVVEEKGAEVVRFITPKSPFYSLTEVRVLFPSSVMMIQDKPAAPVTLTKAVEKENTLAQSFYKKEDQKQKLETILKVLSAAASLGILVVFLLRFRGGPGDSSSLLHHDPLYLYMIDRNGRSDEYAFLAGLYSLVERGMATVETVQSKGRFQKDPEAPDETLQFTLNVKLRKVPACDQKLIKMLFKNRKTFTIHDLAGVTKREKILKKGSHLHKKVRYYQEQQEEWADCIVQELKNDGFFSSGIPSFLKKLMLLTVYAFILYAYAVDSLAASTSIVYGVIGLVLLLVIWRKPKKRWPVILFYIVSIIAVAMLYDTDAALWLLLFILLNALLYALTPRFLLSSEAAITKSDINKFQKMKSIPEGDLEKWMVRSLLLRAKRSAPETPVEPAMAATAPLAYLMLTDQEPVNYVAHTWKWSAPPGSSSSSSDGGGGFFGDSGGGSDGGGGDGGGGGGGD